MAKNDAPASAEEQKIPTAKLKASKRFSEKYHRDLVSALLKEDSYTIAEAEKILDEFLAGSPAEESAKEAAENTEVN